jgi:hypothetical protein
MSPAVLGTKNDCAGETNINLPDPTQKESDQKEFLDVGGRIILRWIIEKYNRVVWTGLIWLRIREQYRVLMNMYLRVP